MAKYLMQVWRAIGMTTLLLACAWGLAACAAKGPWTGAYVGDVTESSQLGTRSATNDIIMQPGGRAQKGVTVTVAQRGDGSVDLTFGDCTLRLQPPDGNQTTVAPGQSCEVSFNRFKGRLNFSGQVWIDGNGMLMMQLVGAGITPDVTGGYSYFFRGSPQQ